jgi:hypothetical protein
MRKKLRYNQSNVIKSETACEGGAARTVTSGVGRTQRNINLLNTYSLPHLTVLCKFYLPICWIKKF